MKEKINIMFEKKHIQFFKEYCKKYSCSYDIQETKINDTIYFCGELNGFIYNLMNLSNKLGRLNIKINTLIH